MKRFSVGLCAASLLLPVSGAMAAGPDVRLVTAAAQQDKAAVRALVKQGVDVNAATADGATALLWAAHWNDLETAGLLLHAHAAVNEADDHGVTPLALACENGNAAMVDTLLKAGANADAAQTNGVTPLMTASRTGSAAVVRLLLAHHAIVNTATTEAKQTALMWATAERHHDVMRLLVDAGADVHASSATGFTPLLFAARNGDIDAARLLIAAGVGVNEPGSDGTHVLPLAIVSGQDGFALFLLDSGADANGALFGVRALHAAAGDVQMWIRDWLRVRGIDGTRALVTLPQDRRVALVKALLAHGADPNARITASATVQYWLTTKRGAFEPFSVGTGDLKGATPLWVAAFSMQPDVMRALITGGADVSLSTADGTTALMAAAGLGKVDHRPALRGDPSPEGEAAVRLLVEAGADVNAVNEAKFTALHGAAFRGANENVQFLVAHGANINAMDFRQRTPFRIAQGAKQTFHLQEWPETAELLRKLGADTTLGVDGHELERNLERNRDAKTNADRQERQ